MYPERLEPPTFYLQFSPAYRHWFDAVWLMAIVALHTSVPDLLDFALSKVLKLHYSVFFYYLNNLKVKELLLLFTDYKCFTAWQNESF